MQIGCSVFDLKSGTREFRSGKTGRRREECGCANYIEKYIFLIHFRLWIATCYYWAWVGPVHQQCFLGESVYSFSKVVVELDQMVKRMVLDAYGVGRLSDSYQASTPYQLRCINYKSQLTNETTDLGLIPHTDKNFTSILHQNDIGGLQIKTKDGEWIEAAPSSPSSFLVLTSDLFMAWSNERISACEHQVVLKEKKARYSLALFSYIGDGVVQVPEEFVDDKHPLKYKPFGHFDYLRFYETDEEARKSNNPIKAYCGV